MFVRSLGAFLLMLSLAACGSSSSSGSGETVNLGGGSRSGGGVSGGGDAVDTSNTSTSVPSVQRVQAVGPNGDCTPAVMQDTKKMGDDLMTGTQEMLRILQQVMANPESKSAKLAFRVNVAGMIRNLKAYREKYGPFACNFTDANGQRRVLNPSELYAKIDELEGMMSRIN